MTHQAGDTENVDREGKNASLKTPSGVSLIKTKNTSLKFLRAIQNFKHGQGSDIDKNHLYLYEESPQFPLISPAR